MITTGAVIHGDRGRLLGYDPAEHPVALQLGGSDPRLLAECARIAEDLGYDEINLNVGCPSDRVQEGRFGACLMAEPVLVGECIAAMKAKVAVPVTSNAASASTSKTRKRRSMPSPARPRQAGRRTPSSCMRARRGSRGLSPRENRDVPPLDYDRVHRLKAAHPRLALVLNGGIASLDQAAEHLRRLDGVMMGPRRLSGSRGNSWRSIPCCLASRRRSTHRRRSPRHLYLYRARARAWCAAPCHHPPSAGPLSRPCRARAHFAGIWQWKP